MSKKSLIMILILLLGVLGVGMYSTYSFNPEAATLDESKADYNIIYSLKDKSMKMVTVNSNEEKYVDITLKNTYDANLRYGMYYYINNLNNNPDGLKISLSPDSNSKLEDIIKPDEEKIISLIINNNSEYNIDLTVGSLVGFENGDVLDLVKDGEVLIK